MIVIDDVMQKFCDAGADAVRRYLDVSGEDAGTMPEYFMPAFVLDRLGDRVTSTLETNFGALVEWNVRVRERRRLGQQPHDERLLLLAQQSNGRRVDMVLFEGEEEGKPKDQQDMLALVEFKRGYVSANREPGRLSDRDKLLMLLAYIDTCPWGIVCGWTNKDHLEWQKQHSLKETSDRWYEKQIEMPETFNTKGSMA
jgi:hypothetical protein